MFTRFQIRFRRLLAAGALLSMALIGSAAAQEKTVTLSKESVIEIVFIDLKHGKRDVFFEDFFSNAVPLIESHGGSVKARFATFDVAEGDITPQYVLLLEWPSVSAFDEALKDNRAAPFIEVRRQSLRALHFGLFRVAEDVVLTLEEDVVYEFFAGNFASDSAPEVLGEFFQMVIPTALQYGRRAIDLRPVDYSGDNYDRMFAGIGIWPSAAHFYQFTNTNVYREGAERLKDPALAQQEIISTYFVPE